MLMLAEILSLFLSAGRVRLSLVGSETVLTKIRFCFTFDFINEIPERVNKNIKLKLDH